MYKEIIITVLIVTLIFGLDIITSRYTANAIDELSQNLDELKTDLDTKSEDNIEEKTNNISKEKPGTITDINKNGITVSTKDYDIILKNIKLEGKNRCDVKDFINGIKKENFIGGIFNE